jgi:N-acetyltransferase 10
LPDIIAVVQVALEGQISKKAVQAQLARGHRSAGDLIPWTISQQFGDSNFAQLNGARIVRVAVHPSLQSMGYGSRAIELLYRYYNGEIFSFPNDHAYSSDEGDEADSSADDDGSSIGINSLSGIQGENLLPRKGLPPLLLPIAEVKAPKLDWVGTSFGLTYELHQFWKRNGMHLLYLRQTKNELTGENSAIMIRALPRRTGFDDAWLPAFACDTKRRLISLLAGIFRDMDVKLAMAILEQFEATTASNKKIFTNHEASTAIVQRSGFVSEKLTLTELNYLLTPHDLKRIDLYGRNLCDHYLIADLLPALARLYFSGRLGVDFQLSGLQAAIMCGLGLQNRTIDEIGVQLGLPTNQILAIFNKTVRKISLGLNSIAERTFEAELIATEDMIEAENDLNKLRDVYHQTLDEDAEDGAADIMNAFGS